jgi:putative phosphoesterase
MSTQNTYQKCDNNSSYCKFGSAILSKLITEFEEQVEGAIGDIDVEFIHKTRVTSRRLRSALSLFSTCFPKKRYKEWIREIKKVTRLLANARDLDVQIIFITKYLKGLESNSEKTKVKVFLKDHQTFRKSIQSSINYKLEELKATEILGSIHKQCEQTLKDQANHVFEPQNVLQEAYWRISLRLDDFLSMEKYVHLENEKIKHHEMRILAKKLRYTMEIFASLYKSNLSPEIETIKEFQDVLGEMHDCDVWIDCIPKLIEQTEKKYGASKLETSLLNFQSYVIKKRKEHFKEFAALWDEKKKDSFFDGIRDKTKAVFPIVNEEIRSSLEKSRAKIGVIADVHANFQALKSVLDDAKKKGAIAFLNAGDLVGFGAFPNEVIELLCEENVLSVVGNYDLEVIEGRASLKEAKNIALKFARRELAKSHQHYIQTLPHELRLQVAGKRILVTHGSPESIEEHIYKDTPPERLTGLANTAKADVIITGHSHQQFWQQIKQVNFINPGSVGRPGDGNPQAAYAILEFNPFKVELIRIDYDVEASVDALRKKRLPESFSQMLLRGVSLDTIIEEDRTKEDEIIKNCKVFTKASLRFSKKYLPDSEHCIKVTQLALDFFDGLTKVHKLGKRERCWLECASFLHDIGLSMGRARHHKNSAKLILNDTSLPFTSKDRRIVASITRYHRRALPKQIDNNLATLDQKTIRKIMILSSLLRIADSLDYTHQGNVKKINVKVSTKRIIAECFCEKKVLLEEQAFNKKKDLFEKTFNKKMVLIWRQIKKLPDKL